MLLKSGKNWVTYLRCSEHQIALIIIYCGDEDCTLDIPLWRASVTDKMEIRRVLKTDGRGYNAGQTKRYTENGILSSRLRAKTGKIYLIDF